MLNRVAEVTLQRLDDGLDDVAMGAVAAPDVDVRLGVRRAFFLGDPFQRRLAVVGAKQGAGVAAASALRQDVDGRVQPDRDRPRLQKLAGARIDEDSAAGRNHPHLSVDQPRDEAALAIPIILLAEPLENLGGGEAGRVLDLGVAVHERQAEPARQAAADGRFADAHQADEHDRPIEMLQEIPHSKGLYSALPPRQKRPNRKDRSQAMPRIAILVIVLVLIIGGLVLLSTLPRERPTQTIQVDVPQPANAH
jgi:hypothetical protein